jgi:flavodoxin
MTQEIDTPNSKRSIVIFDTRYGNTENIARSLEAGLKHTGTQTDCINAKQVSPELLRKYGLIAVGAPTEWLTASKPMKEFFETLNGTDLSRKYGFAFDTKLSRLLSGSAAKFIEKEMKKIGLRLIAPSESAIVFATGSSMSTMRLKDGEEKRFEEIGRKIGALFVGKTAEAVHA